MKIFFDTEFIEDGRTIDLISIGMVRDDGAELYMESSEVDWSKASQWVIDNVKPHLQGTTSPRHVIASAIRLFAGERPEFWAYFAAYDWIVLCQLYGRMIDLPPTWPMFCRDLRQALDGIPKDEVPQQTGTEHHALADARWVRKTHLWLMNRSPV